jgi:ribosomal protein S18 acetylase RimI-like enzyme
MTFETRQAGVDDVDDMADAHRESIRSIGPAFYPADVVAHWQAGVTSDLYRRAMENGEVFFIAIAEVDGRQQVLGFASDYVVAESKHGVSAYVRGCATRRGVGSRLLQLAVTHAQQRGATILEIESSLAAVEFYKANGFVELARGEITLTTGHPIECVFMRQDLTQSRQP